VLQTAQQASERRRDPREPKAFALWLRPENDERCTSAWMLNLSAGGAALLTDASRTPVVGQRVQLVEMYTHDQFVREGLGPLPRYGRVLRHDDNPGLTRRIAIRFEADDHAHLVQKHRAVLTATCPRTKLGPLPPPPISTGLSGRAVR
jgi:hypothetical protein